jgi:LPXTG-motif cell wall-anchored protein
MKDHHALFVVGGLALAAAAWFFWRRSRGLPVLSVSSLPVGAVTGSAVIDRSGRKHF